MRFVRERIFAPSTPVQPNATSCCSPSYRGIREGDKCLCLIDDAEPALVRDQVEQHEGDHPTRSEQLDVDRASDAYLQSGRFSVGHMTSFLSAHLNLAAKSEFPLLRAAGEMSWVLPQPEGAEDFFVYEWAVNKIVDDKPAVFMCMYDLDRVGVSMLVDVLTTHPKVLLGGMVLDNPHYLTPRSIWRPRPPPPRPVPRFEGRVRA